MKKLRRLTVAMLALASAMGLAGYAAYDANAERVDLSSSSATVSFRGGAVHQ